MSHVEGPFDGRMVFYCGRPSNLQRLVGLEGPRTSLSSFSSLRRTFLFHNFGAPVEGKRKEKSLSGRSAFRAGPYVNRIMKRKTKAAFGRVADDETFVSDSWTSKSC